jgi:hypothetical protein
VIPWFNNPTTVAELAGIGTGAKGPWREVSAELGKNGATGANT